MHQENQHGHSPQSAGPQHGPALAPAPESGHHHPHESSQHHQPAAQPHIVPAQQSAPSVEQLPQQPTASAPVGLTSLPVGEQNQSQNRESVPVVKVWSVRGVEYGIMSFMLWFLAASLTWVLVALVTGNAGFIELSPPLALIIVSLPVFAFFFLRLKKAELEEPSLRFESTKRRFSQITQVVSFAVTFFATLTIVAATLAKLGGDDSEIVKTILGALMFIIVWGALFGYYWFDEHKVR